MTRSDWIVARPSRALRMATRLGGDAIMSDGSGAGVRECFGNAELSARDYRRVPVPRGTYLFAVKLPGLRG